MKKRNFLTSSRETQFKEQRYRNPLKTNGSRISKKLLAAGTLLMLSAVAVPFLLAYAPIFKLETTTIEGATSIPVTDIEQVINDQKAKNRYVFFSQKSSIYFDKTEALKILNERFNLEKASITTENKHILVNIEERIVQTIWQDADQAFFLDSNGSTVQPLTDEQKELIERRKDPSVTVERTEFQSLGIQEDIPVIYSLANQDLTENQALRDTDFVNKIRSIEKLLRSMHWRVLYYRLDEVKSESIRIYTNKDLYIHLNLDERTEEQIQLINEIEITDELEYIDLRFGNHVYIK